MDVLQHYNWKYYKESVVITEDSLKILNQCTTGFYLKECGTHSELIQISKMDLCFLTMVGENSVVDA